MLETFPEKSRVRASYTLLSTPIGWVGVVGNGKGIIALLREKKSSRLRRNLAQYDLPSGKGEKSVLRHARYFLEGYFRGDLTAPPRLNFISQTPFQKKVLHWVEKVPYGETRTYEWIAKGIGRPKGARACGQVLRQNPFPLLIPCHRIVRKSGEKGGFAWGKEIKERLLQRETRKEK